MHSRLWVGAGLIGAVALALPAAARGPAKRMETPPGAARLLAAIDEAEADPGRLPALVESAPPHSPLRERLEAGDLAATREMLAFRPLDEAPIPEGFPAFTPVGLIEVKRYPAYRRATGDGFWPLFNHIKTQSIPMTAPVEMTSAADNRGGEMAFLYQNTKVGKPGPIDGIEVEDAAPAVVVSLGVRGNRGRSAVADARKRLEAWVGANPGYAVAKVVKPFRLFGYNSPMVPGDQRYWEAQLRIVPKVKKSVTDDGASTNDGGANDRGVDAGAAGGR